MESQNKTDILKQFLVSRYGASPSVLKYLSNLQVKSGKGKTGLITDSKTKQQYLNINEDEILNLNPDNILPVVNSIDKTLGLQNMFSNEFSNYKSYPTQSKTTSSPRYRQVQSRPEYTQQEVFNDIVQNAPQTFNQIIQPAAQGYSQAMKQLSNPQGSSMSNIGRAVAQAAQTTRQAIPRSTQAAQQVAQNVQDGNLAFSGIFGADPAIITQTFGQPSDYDVFSGGINYGVDFAYGEGVPINLPPGKWKIEDAYGQAQGRGYIGNNENSGYGNSVLAKNLDTGEKFRVSHLSKVNVAPGQTFEGGLIGYSGGTGNVTGPHVDFEYYDKSGRPADILSSPYKDQLYKKAKSKAPALTGTYTPTPSPMSTVKPGQSVSPKKGNTIKASTNKSSSLLSQLPNIPNFTFKAPDIKAPAMSTIFDQARSLVGNLFSSKPAQQASKPVTSTLSNFSVSSTFAAPTFKFDIPSTPVYSSSQSYSAPQQTRSTTVRSQPQQYSTPVNSRPYTPAPVTYRPPTVTYQQKPLTSSYRPYTPAPPRPAPTPAYRPYTPVSSNVRTYAVGYATPRR